MKVAVVYFVFIYEIFVVLIGCVILLVQLFARVHAFSAKFEFMIVVVC